MKLTIGMMVKNESKYLERCLESVQPIMKAIPSELVIIDTGSEDNTVEIARRYTDKVYFHPWDNNFSGMRNKTISYAKGEWFLVIDGDEVLQDTKPLIEFLKSKESGKYGVACISVKNITTESDDTNYSVLVSPRLFKRNRHFRYEGVIHNQPVFKGLATTLDMSLLHYGYMATDKELMERKFIRTSTILKAELEKEPNNVYYWYQLSVTYGMYKDYDGSLKYALQAYQVLHTNDLLPENHMYVYTHLAFVYQTLADFKKVEEICKEALTVQKCMYIDIYYFLAEALTVLEKVEEALPHYETYISMVGNYAELIKDDGVIDYTVGQIDKVYFNLCNIYMRMGSNKIALDYGKKVKDREIVTDLTAKMAYLFIKENQYQDLKQYYEELITLEDRSIINMFLQSIENEKYQLTSEKKKELIQVFTMGDDIYALLNKVMLDEWNDTQEADTSLVNEIYRLDFAILPIFYGELLYYLLKYDHSLVTLFVDVKEPIINNYFEYLRLRKNNLSNLIIVYLQGQPVGRTFQQVKLNKLISKYALLIDNLDDQEYRFAMQYYIREGIKHLLTIYQPSIIENEIIEEMKSKEEIFFTYLALGQQHKEEGNSQEYLAYLTKALHAFPEMKKVVEYLLATFKEESDSKTPELEKYKEQIKKNIREFIEQGKILEALALIKEYESIVTDDLEVFSMKAVIAIIEKRLGDAKQILEEGLKIKAYHFDLVYNLAYVYEMQGNYIEAIHLYRKISAEETSEKRQRDAQDAVAAIEKQYYSTMKNSIVEKTKKKHLKGDSVPNVSSLQAEFKVLHGTMEIANQMYTLTQALRQKKISARSVNYYQTYLAYDGDLSVNFDGCQTQAQIEMKIREFATKALDDFDLFHFYFGTSLTLDHSDLPLLKSAGKRVLMNYMGSDVRRLSIAQKYNPYSVAKIVDETNIIRNMEKIARNITNCAVGDQELYLYVKDFFPNVHVLPAAINLSRYCLQPTKANPKPLFVHAPTSPEVKGTKYILRAIEILQQEYDFDFQLIQGMTHEQAKLAYQQADLIIDQILIGSHGLLAVEAMAMGKPVIGWISDYMRDKYFEDLPILIANPDTITDVLRHVLCNIDMLPELGKRGRRYVEKNHDANRVAEKLISIYQGL